MLQYGSEIWGLDRQAAALCESVHLFGLKTFLGVKKRTPNELVYGETNRYPIYINSAIRCIQYWLKLLRMNNDRLPRKSYNMLYDLDSKGKNNWVTNVRRCLFMNGFGYAWENQGVGNEHSFIQTLRQRLIDCQWQIWDSHLETSDRYSVYRTYASHHSVKAYLLIGMEYYMRRILTRFRLGISDIRTHKYRYSNVSETNLLCPFCIESQENEVHFLLKCPVYHDLRLRYIDKKYYALPCFFRFCLLMSTQNVNTIWNLSMYMLKAFKLREDLLS